MAEAAAKTGRKRDPIWTEFERLPGNKAKCRHCEQPEIISGVAHRMKTHYLKYHQQRKKHSIKNSSLTKTSSQHSDVSKLAKHDSTDENKTINQAIEKFFIDFKIPAYKANHPGFINMTKALHPGYKIPDDFEESLNYQQMLTTVMEKMDYEFVTSLIEIEYNCQHLPEKFTIKYFNRYDESCAHAMEVSLPAQGITNFQQIFNYCLEKRFFIKDADALLTGVLTKQFYRPPQLHKQKPPLLPVYEYSCQVEAMNQIHVELQKSDLFRSIQDHAGNNFLQFSIDEQLNFVRENFNGIDRDLTGPFAINCARAKNLLFSLRSSTRYMEGGPLSNAIRAWKDLLFDYDESLKTEDRKWLELAQRLYEKHVPVFALVAYAVDPAWRNFGDREKLTELERETAANWVQEFYPECYSDYQKFTGISTFSIERLFESCEGREEFLEDLVELGSIKAPFAAMVKILLTLPGCPP